MANDDLAFLNGILASQGNSSADAAAAGGGAPQANGQASADDTTATQTSALGSVPDMASLQPILQALKISAGSEEDLANMSDESISALLAKLDEANTVTDGLESRLDHLLGQLDGMLESLESSNADAVEQEIEVSVQENEAGRANEEDSVVNGQMVNHNAKS